MSSKIIGTEIVMVPSNVEEVIYASTGVEPNLEEILKENENTKRDDRITGHESDRESN